MLTAVNWKQRKGTTSLTCMLDLSYSQLNPDEWGIERLWATASSGVHVFAAAGPVHYG